MRNSLILLAVFAALIATPGRVSHAQEMAWQRTFGGAESDRAESVQQTADGGYILAGLTESYGAGRYDAWLIKIAPEVTAVGQEAVSAALPGAYRLHQNQPNPFNPQTTIRYELPQRGHVTLGIYTLAGQQIAKLVSGYQQPGEHQAVWDASVFASGLYLYKLHAARFTQTRRMVLLK